MLLLPYRLGGSGGFVRSQSGLDTGPLGLLYLENKWWLRIWLKMREA